jgi:uncharacterized protein (TIGR02594 family)
MSGIFNFLKKEGAPKMLVEGLKLFGIKEFFGKENNQIILDWAKEIDIRYDSDVTPWCGLFMGVIAKRAGKSLPENPLWALNWNKFGVKQAMAMLGDVLTFVRPGGGHVGLYVYETKSTYGVLGGNQNNSVSITEVSKSRLKGIRRPAYSIQPANVRQIFKNSSGILSTNEE